jgi:hypothetical protein
MMTLRPRAFVLALLAGIVPVGLALAQGGSGAAVTPSATPPSPPISRRRPRPPPCKGLPNKTRALRPAYPGQHRMAYRQRSSRPGPVVQPPTKRMARPPPVSAFRAEVSLYLS